MISARIFDYEYHANKWASQIGKEHVKIRPYEKSQFVGGDIFSDFLDAVGFTCSNQFERIRNDPNPSLSRIQLSLARKLAPLVEQSDLSILLTPIKELDTQDSNFFLPPLERAQLLKEYRGTNNSVAEKYLNRGELFEDQLVSDMDSWRPLDHTPVDYTRRFFEYFQGKSGADFDRIRAALRAVLKEDSARNTF